jgi:hypothetical protein
MLDVFQNAQGADAAVVFTWREVAGISEANGCCEESSHCLLRWNNWGALWGRRGMRLLKDTPFCSHPPEDTQWEARWGY